MNGLLLQLLAASAAVPASTAGTAFPALAAITEGFESGTPTSVTSNTITVTAGQRVIFLFHQMRGSSSSPSALRAISSLVGAGDFSGIDADDMTIHEAETKLDDAEQGGVAVYIYSWVASVSGTGAFTLTWGGSVWATLLEAHVRPACSVAASEAGGANNAGTSIALDFGGTPNANDMALSICAVRDDDDESPPTDFTEISNRTGGTTNRVFTAYDLGSVAQTPTWTGLNSSHPAAAAAILLRRT